MKSSMLALLAVVALAVGCNKEEKPKQTGVQVNAPGVNVQVDGKAGSVKVDVGK